MVSFYPGIMYVIAMALGMVMLENVIAQISPVLSLFITSIFAVIFFHLVSKTKIKTLYHSCWQHRQEWLIVNLIVGIVWLASYYSVKWVTPTAFLFLFFLALTACHHLRQLIRVRKLNRNIINVIMPVIFITIFYVFHHDTDLEQWGIVAGVIAGIAGSYYNTSSKAFAIDSGLRANDVLAVRFYVILLFIPFFLRAPMFSGIDLVNILELILVSVFTFILPLYMSQRSLMQLPIDKHTMIIAFTPLVAYIFQGLFLNQWSSLLLIMSVITVLFLSASSFLSKSI